MLSSGASAQVDRVTFCTHMTADQAVPPSASGATSEAEFVLDLRNKQMTYRVVTQCVGPVPTLQVGIGGPGVNGTLIHSDYQSGYDMYEGTMPALTDAQVAALYAGNVYAQIATTFVFEAVEIRGQLQPVQHKNAHVTTLSGNQVNPPNASTATGSARLSVNRPDNTLNLDLTCSGLPADAWMAELRFGTPTMNGPIIAAFQGGPDRWGETTSPLTPFSSLQLYLIEQGFTYLTILSNAYPAGEIRGQIEPNPMRHGFGSDNGNGRIHIGHIGPHTLGNTNWTAIVTDTYPGSLAHLAIGFGNVDFGGATLPLDLNTGVGIYRSFQWIDATGGLDYYTVTDSLGYAAVNVPILDFPQSIGVTAWYQWIVQEPVGGQIGVSDAMKVVVQ